MSRGYQGSQKEQNRRSCRNKAKLAESTKNEGLKIDQPERKTCHYQCQQREQPPSKSVLIEGEGREAKRQKVGDCTHCGYRNSRNDGIVTGENFFTSRDKVARDRCARVVVHCEINGIGEPDQGKKNRKDRENHRQPPRFFLI